MSRTRARTSPTDLARAEFHRWYATGETPWDSGIACTELGRRLDAGELPGASVLEMGCGTGTNAIELARRGWSVTAVDLADLAIRRARRKAQRAGVDVRFRAGDLTRMRLDGPYDLLFDLGLYHILRQRDLAGLLSVVERVSRPGTRWLCIAGNAREPSGPPVVSEAEFRSELGGLFRFLDVREFRIEARNNFRPLGWSILMERRGSSGPGSVSPPLDRP